MAEGLAQQGRIGRDQGFSNEGGTEGAAWEAGAVDAKSALPAPNVAGSLKRGER